MAHTHTVLLYHIIFSTKKRIPLLKPPVRDIIYPYISGTIKELNGKALIINGTDDHLHILCQLRPKPDVAEVVKKIKGSSSKHFRKESGDRGFFWQEGYGAFTVSISQRDVVYQYIFKQEEHHKDRSFADEYRGLLVKHEIDFDERFYLD